MGSVWLEHLNLCDTSIKCKMRMAQTVLRGEALIFLDLITYLLVMEQEVGKIDCKK